MKYGIWAIQYTTNIFLTAQRIQDRERGGRENVLHSPGDGACGFLIS